jgi:hypothetical protein
MHLYRAVLQDDMCDQKVVLYYICGKGCTEKCISGYMVLLDILYVDSCTEDCSVVRR